MRVRCVDDLGVGGLEGVFGVEGAFPPGRLLLGVLCGQVRCSRRPLAAVASATAVLASGLV